MKNILLHVQDDPGMEARFQTALSLARHQGGHLTCLQVTPTPYFPADGPISPETFNLFVDSVEVPAREQRAALEARLGSDMVSWDWRARNGNSAIEILREALLADVIVAGTGDEAPDISTVGALVVHGHVPILAVSGDVSQFDPGGPIMIAWNGKAEAANSVRHSLPLMKSAANVHIATITEQLLDFPATDVAAYLSRHGIHAEIHERRADPSVAEALTAAARELGASCIVMGGYGHSRYRERMFGGVTRALLQDCPIPLLLSH
ncbi:universal stress protein [Rhizorhapis sp. SPR117]|uniref:universal stress protein n=1 Tax=Rhizorhapis sp. SPR117 TaxID=2912611 RepID=UPI001F2EAB28|nr:universal stress protein [Rhizorhapis sp. SPR117]